MSDKLNDKIVLLNERSGHVEKLVNELSTGGFFKYSYSKDMFKIFGLNLLMCVFLAPLVVVYYKYMVATSAFNATLPSNSSVGMGFVYWAGLQEYSTSVLNGYSSKFWLLTIPCITCFGFALAGGLCVLRDAFWTGRVKVFKTFFKGIYECGLVVVIGIAVIAAALCGIMELNMAIANLAVALKVLINIALWIVFALFVTYCFTLFSVTATYKQSLGVNMRTAWGIMFKYITSTLFNVVMTFVPVYLVLLLGKTTFWILLAVLILMIGLFYIPLVWQTHMMKIFSIYHPVEKKVTKRKKAYN